MNGDIVKEINFLKKKKGKDILVYGGSSFVSSLIQRGLTDEFYFLLNPVAVGKGKAIFKSLKDNLNLTLNKNITFTCGTVLLCYKPKKQ
jgi:dihydrofolate reductase